MNRERWKWKCGNAEVLTVGGACKAISFPTPGLLERTFDSSGFNAERTLISVSAEPHRLMARERLEFYYKCVVGRGVKLACFQKSFLNHPT